MRSIAWLSEPREAAADVTSDVFVGLPEAAKHYREEGKAEWWLKQVAVRAALRKKEALTGRWATGGKSKESERGEHGVRGRSYTSFEETADQIIERLDAVEQEELLELRRRRDALRNSPDEMKRRWDEFLELYVAGYDFKEIGERMGLTEGSARNWLCKIRKHLTQPVSGE
jgi:RNA polymerase sigma factor (sigma-70 family)